jgi:DNA-binding transcriptional MocR family regulator
MTMLSGTYGAAAGSERHRTAGATWIGRRTDPARVFVTAGTQNALFLAFAAAARPDETVLCESVTYHGAKAIAQLLRIRLEPLPMDRYGILPDAFERAARGRNVKALFTTPSLQNPTGLVMPEKRRRDLAAAAEKHGITIIEDDVCGFLLEEAPTPFATLLPERTIFLTGLGKAITPALRIGYLAAPEAFLARVQSALAASTLFTSPILAELAATWIEDGTANRLAAQKRAEVARRTTLARRILGKRANASDLRSSNLWLELPRRWSADAFTDEARRRNVRVASASSFAFGDDVPRFVRVSIAAPATIGELESALHVLAAIDEERPEAVI